jgi:hypothetical protein
MNQPEKLNSTEAKEKILYYIRTRGPSLPMQIAKELNQSSWISSAFLSELLSERKLKISNVRVGGSPLYFIPGQEKMLEKFYTFMNHKEKDAFTLLKENQILEDSKQEPSIRVALRSLKDFAFPLSIRVQSQEFLFWRFFTKDKDEAEKIAYKKIGIHSETKKEDPVKQIQEKPQIKEEKPKTETQQEKTNQKMIPIILKDKPKQKKEMEESEFVKKMKSVLEQKNIEVLEEIESKKKEFTAKVRINSEVGKINFLCVAKDKKTISDTDLTVSLQKSQSSKLPLLILSNAKLTKKAESYLDDWRNLIKVLRY